MRISFSTAVLLATSALSAPALAQTGPSSPTPPPSSTTSSETLPDDRAQTDTVRTAEPGADPAPTDPATEEPVDISGPGAEVEGQGIVITGNIPSVIRATPQVVSVLSSEDIARQGDGDVAGALQRVTGLSVVGGRFVYVRGLGERYSLALLNGAPLPSPEPLRRVVPLDLFPTSILASTVVQKSYSASYPGEFGGGVINLTTRVAPREAFLTAGAGISGDSETTGLLGYTYYGSDTDFTGFDDGTRSVPEGLASAIASGNRVIEGANFTRQQIQSITAGLVNSPTTVIQKNGDIPPNFSGSLAGGKTFALGGADLGVIATAGLSNSWRTRFGRQQLGAQSGDALIASQDFRFVSTQNRAVVNGFLATGLEFGENKIRINNLFIRDTLKEARVSVGNDTSTISPSQVRPDATLQTGITSWFERQLYDVQGVGEFKFGRLAVDLRGTYANSKRRAPYERAYSYAFNDLIGDYTNDLRAPGQNATIAFSNLNDDVYYGAIDLGYKLPTAIDWTVSAGYAYTDNDRQAVRRDFEFFPAAALPLGVAQERIDYLLSDFNVYQFNVLLRETTGGFGSAAYNAKLRVHAGYVETDIQPIENVRLNLGVRYEDGRQSVTPLALVGAGSLPGNTIRNDYFLPAGTLTYTFARDMQLRVAASRTIARPQFRELAPQPFRDTESSRTFFGNVFLQDSELTNAEARYEWYFGRDQRFTLAGFYKHLDKPIEATAVQVGSTFITSFANAPRADLYGGEVELVKYVPLERLGGSYFGSRRLVLIGNYTYTESEVKVREGDTTVSFTSAPAPIDAALVFDTTRKLRLTGQSRHLANVQVGIEDTDRLSQATLIMSYASRRATNRGPNLTPDFVEKPGVQLDFVAREGVPFIGRSTLELKFEARNILGTPYSETQTLGDSRLQINSYDVGRTFGISAAVTF